MIRFLLDADSAIYAMSGGNDAMRARVESYEPGEIAISTISYAEIAYGIFVGKLPSPPVLEAFVAAIPLIAFDEPAARAYAALPFKRARFDRLLAAHALSIGSAVITNNLLDFADIPGLTTQNWSLPL